VTSVGKRHFFYPLYLTPVLRVLSSEFYNGVWVAKKTRTMALPDNEKFDDICNQYIVGTIPVLDGQTDRRNCHIDIALCVLALCWHAIKNDVKKDACMGAFVCSVCVTSTSIH